MLIKLKFKNVTISQVDQLPVHVNMKLFACRLNLDDATPSLQTIIQASHK